MAPRTSLALFLTLNLLLFTYTYAACPANVLQIGACVTALNLVNITVGTPPVTPCCSLINGLAGLEAAVCLCTMLRTNIAGITLNLPIDISVLLNNCGRPAPNGFTCP